MAIEKEPESVIRGRISFLKVLLDIIPPDELPDIISGQLAQTPGNAPNVQRQNIILLSLWDLLKARRNSDYRNYILNAFMVLPISKSLVGGSYFLKRKKPVRYMPFRFFIDLLGILESREYTIYLLGGNDKTLKRVENNIHQTFPRLRIVGRRSAFRKQEEGAIIEAIRKASPHLLLVGRGIRGGEMWIARNSAGLNRGLRLWCSDLFDVLTEKKSRPGDNVFNHGLEAFYYALRNPLKIFRVFNYIRYKFLLLFYKIFNKD